MKKSIYVTFMKKCPKKLLTSTQLRYNIDYDAKNGWTYGIEIPDYEKLTVNGKEIK